MTLSARLSPTASDGNDCKERISGRFGYQMCTEAIAFTQNLPQRLLLVDQLNRLPTIIHDLLKLQPIRKSF